MCDQTIAAVEVETPVYAERLKVVRQYVADLDTMRQKHYAEIDGLLNKFVDEVARYTVGTTFTTGKRKRNVWVCRRRYGYYFTDPKGCEVKSIIVLYICECVYGAKKGLIDDFTHLEDEDKNFTQKYLQEISMLSFGNTVPQEKNREYSDVQKAEAVLP